MQAIRETKVITTDAFTNKTDFTYAFTANGVTDIVVKSIELPISWYIINTTNNALRFWM